MESVPGPLIFLSLSSDSYRVVGCAQVLAKAIYFNHSMTVTEIVHLDHSPNSTLDA